jgi:hypothetical protein
VGGWVKLFVPHALVKAAGEVWVRTGVLNSTCVVWWWVWRGDQAQEPFALFFFREALVEATSQIRVWTRVL